MGIPIIQDIPKFECAACGKCCSNIQGFAGEAEKAFLSEFAYGKLPLIQLVPVEEMTFPLWDFEARRFRAYAKDLGIDARIRPYRGVLDLKSGRFIVFCYQMDSRACPFLKEDGKCGVYGKERAFVCNLFPLNRSPFLGVDTPLDESMFGTCGRIAGISDRLSYGNKKKLIRQLHQSFGKTFLAAVQHDEVLEWTNRTLMKLMKEGKIRPAMKYPYEFLKRRIQNTEHVDLMDFLVESGEYTQEEADERVRRFRAYADAEEKVEEVLKAA